MKRCLQPQLPYSVQLRSGACFRSASGASGYLPLPCFVRRQRVGATTMRSVASNSSVSRFCARAEQVSQGSRMRGLCPLAVGRKATHLCSSAGHPAGMLLAAESTLVHDRQEDAVSPQLLPRLPYGYPSLHNPCFAVSTWSDSGSPYCSEVFSVFLAPSWEEKASSVSGVIRPQFDPAPEVNPSITPGPSVPDPKLPPADPSPWPSTPPEFRPDVAPSEFPEPETVPSITPTPDPVAPPEMPAPEVSPLEIPYPPSETPVPEIVPVPFPSPEIPSPSPSTWPSSPPLEVPSPHPSIPEISFSAYGMWGRLASLYPCVAGLLLLLPWAITVQPAHPSILPPLPEVGFIQEGISLTGVPRGPPISPPNTPPLTPPGVPLPTPPPSTPPIPPPGAPPPTAPPQTPPIPPGEPGPLPPPTTPPFPPGGLPSPGPPEFPPTPSPGPEIFPPGPNVI